MGHEALQYRPPTLHEMTYRWIVPSSQEFTQPEQSSAARSLTQRQLFIIPFVYTELPPS